MNSDAEGHRVLQFGGWIAAATNGHDHLAELSGLANVADIPDAAPSRNSSSRNSSHESGSGCSPTTSTTSTNAPATTSSTCLRRADPGPSGELRRPGAHRRRDHHAAGRRVSHSWTPLATKDR